MARSRVCVYVDAFNLYYGALRRTPFKWLDLDRMARRLLRDGDDVLAIEYFTARVRGLPADPEQPIRQSIYLRALQTIPHLTIHYGHFLSHRIRMPLADSPTGERVRVLKREEKGSDVNLATHLVHDAHRDCFDTALVVTNDSDLVEPVRIVRRELDKPVGVAIPTRSRPSVVLTREASFVKEVRRGALATSQFPGVLKDAGGTFSRPRGW